MNDEKKLNFAHSFFDFGYDSGEYGDEFVGFFDESFCFLGGQGVVSYQ